MPYCAQRLSASSEFSHQRPVLCATFFEVLNAFRHHRNSHKCLCLRRHTFVRCSTPFGIIGILTACTWFHLTETWRAQRLSASSEFSLFILVHDCPAFVDVLNAFRHHRNSHPNRRFSFLPNGRSAQRLSASSEFSRRH